MVTLGAVLAINLMVGMSTVWILFLNGKDPENMKAPTWLVPVLFFVAFCAASYGLLTNNEKHGLAAFALFVQVGLILLYILLNSQNESNTTGPGAGPDN